MSLEFGYHPLLENYGYFVDKIPQDVFNELKPQIDDLQSNFNKGNKYNHALVGEIEHEYKIPPQSKTKQYIKEISQMFENESQYVTTNYSPIPTLNFSELWVNFQKKHEYNPVHCHGGLYSFVIWYQIPYSLNEESTFHPQKQDEYTNGTFQFLIPEGKMVKNYALDIDKSKEGYVAIFPSNLNHIVYPFYSSDKYRISLSGNVTSIINN